MIVGIGSDRDITYFLNPDECVRLEHEELSGRFICDANIERQGHAFLRIDDKMLSSQMLCVDDSLLYDGPLHVSITRGHYLRFMSTGSCGLRFGGRGSVLTLYDRSRIDTSRKSFADTLEFYRDNQEK